MSYEPADQQQPKSRFGSTALKTHKRIFAMLVRGRLVVKLPASRVAALIAAGDGEAYDAGKGKPLKEWLTLKSERDEQWLALAGEARAFVGKAATRA